MHPGIVSSTCGRNMYRKTDIPQMAYRFTAKSPEEVMRSSIFAPDGAWACAVARFWAAEVMLGPFWRFSAWQTDRSGQFLGVLKTTPITHIKKALAIGRWYQSCCSKGLRTKRPLPNWRQSPSADRATKMKNRLSGSCRSMRRPLSLADRIPANLIVTEYHRTSLIID